MIDIGFTSFDIGEKINPSTQEMLGVLDVEARLKILDGFAKKVSPTRLKHELKTPLPAGYKKLPIIVHLYGKMRDIRNMSRSLLRGEILVTPAVFDDEGKEVESAVYNTPPKTITDLKTQIADTFKDDFTATQSSKVVDVMIKYSKSDGTGDSAYYAAEIVK